MRLPSNLIPIGKWRAFKGRFPAGQSTEHRIVIIYHSADTINYFYVTSKIDKVKIHSRYDEKSLVEISPKDWGALTRNSCIQCNKSHLHNTTEQYIRDAYDRQEIEVLYEVPDIVKDKIIKAINYSKSFTTTEKKLYTRAAASGGDTAALHNQNL